MHITYNTMYFDRNIDLSEKIRMAKKSEGNYSSCELNEEIYFSGELPVDELVLEPKGAGGTVETYLITALLEPKPNWLANVVVAI